MKLLKLLLASSIALGALTARAQSNINLSIVTVNAATVTAGATVFATANTSRQYLQVQNNDSTRTVYVGVLPTVSTTTGIKLSPGQTWAPYKPPASVFYMIGDSGSNANVTWTEGQ